MRERQKVPAPSQVASGSNSARVMNLREQLSMSTEASIASMARSLAESSAANIEQTQLMRTTNMYISALSPPRDE